MVLLNFNLSLTWLRKEPGLMGDIDYWTGVFEKHQTEMMILEDYYSRIENWDFSNVYFWSERKNTYQCHSNYFVREYTTDADYIPKEFLEFSLKDEDFPEGGCRVLLQGDYRKTYEIGPMGSYLDSRILIVEIGQTYNQESYYVYSPNRVPTVSDGLSEYATIKPLENGWYYIYVNRIGVVSY